MDRERMTDKTFICRQVPSEDTARGTYCWPGDQAGHTSSPHPAVLVGGIINASHLSPLPGGNNSTEYIHRNTPTVLQANLSEIAQTIHLKTV